MKKLTLVLALLALVVVTVPASAHDVRGDQTLLKGRSYDGHVGDVSPGDVPMEAMSDIRCEDGMAGIFPCHKVDLASFTPLPDLEASFVNDIWGWESDTGQQIAIVGSIEGTAFVDVTDGSNPVYLGTLPSAYPNNFFNLWGDIRVYGDHAYIGAEAGDFTLDEDGDPDTFTPAEIASFEGHGVQIVDMTQFTGAAGPITIDLAGHIDGVAQSHNLSLNVDSGRLYVAGAFLGLDDCDLTGIGLGSGGAVIYDVSPPAAEPIFLGCLDNEQYNHDLQCVTYHGPDGDYQDREICIGSNESALRIYDATDPSAPQVLATRTYLDLDFCADPCQLPNYYTHQGWLTEDHAYFFLGDELDEYAGNAEERTTYLWDMSDLTDPQVIGVHTDGNTSIDHNMFVDGNLLYQANYSSGLWIYDTWKVEQGRMKDRGYFDVFPKDDVTDFFGAWGTYPYFGDGKVLVSSSDEGLFVLQSRVKSSADDKGRRR